MTFLNYRDVKHGRYLEKLREKYGPRECKNKFMFHRDRDALLKYLSGGPTPENVSRKTRRELNPEQFQNTRKRISPPSRYVIFVFTFESSNFTKKFFFLIFREMK